MKEAQPTTCFIARSDAGVGLSTELSSPGYAQTNSEHVPSYKISVPFLFCFVVCFV